MELIEIKYNIKTNELYNYILEIYNNKSKIDKYENKKIDRKIIKYFIFKIINYYQKNNTFEIINKDMYTIRCNFGNCNMAFNNKFYISFNINIFLCIDFFSNTIKIVDNNTTNIENKKIYKIYNVLEKEQSVTYFKELIDKYVSNRT